MKKTVLLTFTLLFSTTLTVCGQSVRVMKETPKFTVEQLVQQGINKNDVTHLADANTVTGLGRNVPKRTYPVGDSRNNTKPLQRAKAEEQPLELFTVAQSYHNALRRATTATKNTACRHSEGGAGVVARTTLPRGWKTTTGLMRRVRPRRSRRARSYSRTATGTRRGTGWSASRP